MCMQCMISFHIVQYINKYNIRNYFKNTSMVHRTETWICKAVIPRLHYNMSNVWVLQGGQVLPHEFGSGQLYTWVSHATKAKKWKHLTIVIPASLNISGIQDQTWLRGYPHENQIGPSCT